MFCFCVSVLRRHLYRVSQMSSRHAFVRVARPRLFSWLLLLIGALSLLLSGAGSARAETQVSGTIGASVTWSVAQSPIVVTDDVTVDNGAVLSIDAGVTVRFAKGKSLTVQHGGLHAQGAAANPIVLTSVDDVAGGSPAAGDWGALRFLADTNDLATRLEHVRVRYGTGVWIERASPTINLTAIEHNQGPAISVDLHSSPIGIGLSASGNGLDGILVPAGTSYDDIVWGLVGIPYVLQQGTIQVGQAPILLDPAALTMNAGVAGSLRVTVANPAPAGGWHIDLTSSVPSVAGIPSSVLIPEGEQWADIAIAALSVGESTITASHAVFGASSASVKVAQLPALRLQPATATIGTSRPQTMTLRLPEAAADTLIVSLSSANEAVATVPGSVAVAPGQDAVVFEVTGATAGQTVIAAHAQGYASAMAKVVVSPHTIVLPASVVVAPGDSIEIPVVLTDAAPAGGVTVDLSTTHPNVAMVSTPVHFPAGEFHRVVTVQGGNAGQTVLSAVASGYQQAEGHVLVASVGMSFVPGDKVVLPRGLASERRVYLSQPAPPGGLYVEVHSSDTHIAKVAPSVVFVAEGLTASAEALFIQAVAEGMAAVTVQTPGILPATVAVEVIEPTLTLTGLGQSGQSIGKTIVGKGMISQVQSDSSTAVRLQRRLNGSAFSGEPVTVSLSCASAAVCTVPATVTIPGGQSQVRVPVTGVGVGKTTLLASASGYGDSNTIEIEVVEPILTFYKLDGIRSVDSVRDDFYVRLGAPGAYSSGTAAVDTAVSLAVSDAQPAGIIGGFYDKVSGGDVQTQTLIKAGRYDSDDRYVERPGSAGSYTITASAGAATAVSALQTVSAPGLALSGYGQNGQSVGKTVVGKGTTSYIYNNGNAAVRLQRTLNGNAFNGEAALTVSLACVSVTVCSVPETVTIPAGQSQVPVPVTGVGVGKTTLHATVSGYSDSNTIEIEVVEPTLTFYKLDGVRSVESIRDDFYVRLSTPGAYNLTTAATDIPVSLSVSDAQPIGVVSGFYDKASGGTLQTQTLIKAGRYDSDDRYVERPSSVGSYTVTAMAGGTTAVSAAQTVSAPGLVLFGLTQSNQSGNKTVVGQGMTTYQYAVGLRRVAAGQASAGAEALTVALACVSTSVCTVPATVTIPAGESVAYFPVTGVSTGATAIKATAHGYTSDNDLIVDVVLPTLYLHNLATTLAVGSSSSFYVRASVVGGYSNQLVASAVTVTVTNSVPAVGSVAAQIVIPANGYQSPTAQFTAVGAGTTNVTVSAPGFVPATSATISVQ